MSDKILCTIEILTRNSGATLRRTLESVREFDQVIILDGGSTDDTLSIAAEFGCEVIAQDKKYQTPNGIISDFAGVRNQGLVSARHAWFGFVDADEYFSPELVQEIGAMVQGKPAACRVPRKYVLNNTVIERASTYPTQQMRLFHRGVTDLFIKKIHERIVVKPDARIVTLQQAMMVPVQTDRQARNAKLRYYAHIEADRRARVRVIDFVTFVIRHAALSVLYGVRFFLNLFIGSDARLPWEYERDVHVYHILLCRALFLRLIK